MTKKLFESFGEFVDSNFAFGRTLKSINEDVFTMITSKSGTKDTLKNDVTE